MLFEQLYLNRNLSIPEQIGSTKFRGLNALIRRIPLIVTIRRKKMNPRLEIKQINPIFYAIFDLLQHPKMYKMLRSEVWHILTKAHIIKCRCLCIKWHKSQGGRSILKWPKIAWLAYIVKDDTLRDVSTCEGWHLAWLAYAWGMTVAHADTDTDDWK